MGPKAVYAGTFDPVTNGHVDIIKRAAGIFPELVVAVVSKSNKQTLFDATERVRLVEESLAEVLTPEFFKRERQNPGKITVQSFDGLLVDYARSLGARVVIRGLRAVTDYEYEAQMAIINRHLLADIETVFLMTSDNCSFISASIVREIAKLGGDVSGLVPAAVVAALKAKHLA